MLSKTRLIHARGGLVDTVIDEHSDLILNNGHHFLCRVETYCGDMTILD